MKEIRYDEFITALEDGKVTTVSLQPVQLVLEVKGEMKGYKEGEEFVTNIMNDDATQEDIRTLATKTNTEIHILANSCSERVGILLHGSSTVHHHLHPVLLPVKSGARRRRRRWPCYELR